MAGLKKVVESAEAKKSTAPKTAPRSETKASSKPVSAVKSPVASAAYSGPEDMRKKELIDRVAEKSGLKRGVAKQALEASLAVLGDVLAEGRSISAPPLGKLKVVRQKDTPNGRMAVVRVKFKGTETTTSDDET